MTVGVDVQHATTPASETPGTEPTQPSRMAGKVSLESTSQPIRWQKRVELDFKAVKHNGKQTIKAANEWATWTTNERRQFCEEIIEDVLSRRERLARTTTARDAYPDDWKLQGPKLVEKWTEVLLDMRAYDKCSGSLKRKQMDDGDDEEIAMLGADIKAEAEGDNIQVTAAARGQGIRKRPVTYRENTSSESGLSEPSSSGDGDEADDAENEDESGEDEEQKSKGASKTQKQTLMPCSACTRGLAIELGVIAKDESTLRGGSIKMEASAIKNEDGSARKSELHGIKRRWKWTDKLELVVWPPFEDTS